MAIAQLLNNRSSEIALLAGSLAAIGGYYAYLRQIEKRSLRSKVAEITLGNAGVKKVMSDPDKFDQVVQANRVISNKEYSIPRSVKRKVHVRRIETDGMPVYLLSPRKRQAATGNSERHVFHLHGGGYMLQPHKKHWRYLTKLIKRTGWHVSVPIYPTVPKHDYEESFRKVIAQYKSLLREVPTEKIVLMGDSSGGGFALALAQQLKKEGLPQPGNLVLLSPWLDATMEDPMHAELEEADPILSREGLKKLGKLWAGPKRHPGNPFVSPINGDLRDLAPITVFAGTHELFLADARNLKDRLNREGIEFSYYEYPKMNHGFPLYPIPEANTAIGQLISAVKS